MPQVYRLNYQPDLDRNWNANPGLCSDMTGLVPLQNGNLCSLVDSSNLSFNTTGADVLSAEMFTQTDGSVRLLAFRVNDIDEYTSGATRTNRATGLTTATDWAAAAWGNQIIAVSKANATQSSTGAGFTALGGSSPKAKLIAANVNFVMMADVDDGGSNVYTDMVWWSALRNPSSWAPSLATQAGNVRLLDTPGPIKQLVAFQDKFIAFKENSIYMGQYVGPPYVFSWRVINSSIGLSFYKCVTECDGKLFFVHKSGFYSFDGQQFANIGHGVISRIDDFQYATPSMVADEAEGVVWFFAYVIIVGGGTTYRLYPICYNARTGLWSNVGHKFSATSTTGSPQAVVVATHAQRDAFHALGNLSGFSYFSNGSTPAYVAVAYPYTSTGTASFTTGFVGSNDIAPTMIRVYPRFVYGDGSSISSASISGYNDESLAGVGSDGSHTLAWNAEYGTLDGRAQYRYKVISVALSAGLYQIGGLGIEVSGGAKR